MGLSMRKTSLLLVLLLLVTVLPTEIPELVHLSDNVSNDFVLTSFGCKSTPVMDVDYAKVAIPVGVIVPVVLLPVPKSVNALLVVRPFREPGRSLLCLCSILRT